MTDEIGTLRLVVFTLLRQRRELDRRIHNQRRQLRETWEIVENRRKWLGSETARKRCQILSKWLKEARTEIEALKKSAVPTTEITP